jgi:hypothetical protein
VLILIYLKRRLGWVCWADFTHALLGKLYVLSMHHTQLKLGKSYVYYCTRVFLTGIINVFSVERRLCYICTFSLGHPLQNYLSINKREKLAAQHKIHLEEAYIIYLGLDQEGTNLKWLPLCTKIPVHITYIYRASKS